MSLQVLLDDGSGTYSVDITTRVRMVEGAGLSGFGRTDEFSTPGASSLTLVLDNIDGLFTGSGVGFGAGPFGGGVFGGSVDVSPGTGIRYVETIGATTSNRFTGSVESLTLGWPGGGQEWSVVTLGATDRLADAGGFVLSSLLKQETMALSPEFYYTLSEAEGSTSAGDSTGNHPPLNVKGSGSAIQFGQGTGPVDGDSATVFSGGKYLASSGWSSPTFKSFGCWFNIAGTPSNAQVLINAGSLVLVVLDTGTLALTDSAGSILTGALGLGSSYADGQTHFVMVTADGATLLGYVDSPGVGGGFSGNQPSILNGIGAAPGIPTFDNFSGTMSHVMGFDSVLTSGQVSTIYKAGAGLLSETTDARLSRLASYAGLTAITLAPSGQMMGAQNINGQSLFDTMQTVAQAEGGILFADGSGNLIMQGRYYRGLKTTPDYTGAEQGVAPDTTVTWDRQQLINQVTVTRTSGATQVVQAGTPVRLYPQSLELAVDTDANALAAAQFLLSKHETTSPRLSSATFDLLTSSDAASLLALKIGDRVSLASMPSQMWPVTDYTIEGWSSTHTVTEHNLTVNLLPFGLWQVAVWDDSGSLWDSAVWAY